MAIITPTITTADPHEFREQMELIAGFSEGVHIDVADGIFAPSRLMAVSELWRNDDQITHLHVMHQNPMTVVDEIIEFAPDLTILHVESQEVKKCLEKLQSEGVRTGLALLPESSVSELEKYDGLFDHVLIFGGHLGFQGGEADLKLLSKVEEVQKLFPDCEIAWDGGVNVENVARVSGAGVGIINVGGYIKNAEEPEKAYAELTSLIQS